MSRLTYKSSGVDIRSGEAFVRRIKRLTRSTDRPGVIGELGGFGGMFRLNGRYRNPVLVSGTDGVGTKLKIAQMMNRHDTIGIDLVAMCVNDVIVSGAEPLFFLDYLATGKLDVPVSVQIIKGIARGCRQAGCALIGGETAEMPSFYPSGEYDLAGFAVGVVEKRKIIDGSRIRPGDQVIGLASSGLHSNGYSLARKVVLHAAGLKLTDRVAEWGRTVGEELLVPTTIYVSAVRKALERFKVRGMAHITGGGMSGNIPRILPRNCSVVIRRGTWPVPPVFDLIGRKGKLSIGEMYRVFNMGIGMILVVSPGETESLIRSIPKRSAHPYRIGEVVRSRGSRAVSYA
jgi:phosphoribosylformylglycinamidine cyclo-ligase